MLTVQNSSTRVIFYFIAFIMSISQVVTVTISAGLTEMLIYYFNIQSWPYSIYFYVIILTYVEDASRILVSRFSVIRNNVLSSYFIISSFLFSSLETLRIFGGLSIGYHHSKVEIWLITFLLFPIKYAIHYMITKNLFFMYRMRRYTLILICISSHAIFDILATIYQRQLGIDRLFVELLGAACIAYLIFLYVLAVLVRKRLVVAELG